MVLENATTMDNDDINEDARRKMPMRLIASGTTCGAEILLPTTTTEEEEEDGRSVHIGWMWRLSEIIYYSYLCYVIQDNLYLDRMRSWRCHY